MYQFKRKYSHADVPKVQMAILDHFMIITLNKRHLASWVLCMGKGRVQHLHTVLHRRGQRPIRHVVQELPITGPGGRAIYPNMHTTAKFKDTKERFWIGNKEGHVIFTYAGSTHYIRFVPTLTTPSVMCAGTAMKNIVINM